MPLFLTAGILLLDSEKASSRLLASARLDAEVGVHSDSYRKKQSVQDHFFTTFLSSGLLLGESEKDGEILGFGAS